MTPTFSINISSIEFEQHPVMRDCLLVFIRKLIFFVELGCQERLFPDRKTAFTVVCGIFYGNVTPLFAQRLHQRWWARKRWEGGRKVRPPEQTAGPGEPSARRGRQHRKPGTYLPDHNRTAIQRGGFSDNTRHQEKC